jgi:hypothetical protein
MSEFERVPVEKPEGKHVTHPMCSVAHFYFLSSAISRLKYRLNAKHKYYATTRDDHGHMFFLYENLGRTEWRVGTRFSFGDEQQH